MCRCFILRSFMAFIMASWTCTAFSSDEVPTGLRSNNGRLSLRARRPANPIVSSDEKQLDVESETPPATLVKSLGEVSLVDITGETPEDVALSEFAEDYESSDDAKAFSDEESLAVTDGSGGDCCSTGRCGSAICDCGPASRGWFAQGWVNWGFTGNEHDPDNEFNGPVTFNDRANDFQMNQLYLSIGRQTNSSACGWDFGGRVDLLYGSDYFFTTALGLETHGDGSPRWNGEGGPRAAGATLYGLALPQAYAEVFAPLGSGVTVKLGHFYSLLGYESVMATENFFYSRSYTSQYGVPYTHTGALAEYRVTPCLQVAGGMTRGWDNLEDNNENLAFMGRLRWTSSDECSTVQFAVHTGNEDNLGENTRTTYNLVATRRIGCRVHWAIEGVSGRESEGAIRNNGLVDADWYGVTNYLALEMGPRTELGVRFEWFRDEENARVLGLPLDGAEGGDYHALTFGVNHRPCRFPCLIVRPEVRYDWSDVAFPGLGVQGLYNDFRNDTQLTYSINAIARF